METRLCAPAAVCDQLQSATCLQSAMCPSFSNKFVHLAASSPAGFTYDGKVLQEQHSKFSKKKKKKKSLNIFKQTRYSTAEGNCPKVCVFPESRAGARILMRLSSDSECEKGKSWKDKQQVGES